MIQSSIDFVFAKLMFSCIFKKTVHALCVSHADFHHNSDKASSVECRPVEEENRGKQKLFVCVQVMSTIFMSQSNKAKRSTLHPLQDQQSKAIHTYYVITISVQGWAF